VTDAFIAGAGMTRFGRRAEPLETLVREAATAALKEAGVTQVDHVYFGLQNPEEFTGNANTCAHLLSALGLVPTPATRVESAPSTGSSALLAAVNAVRSGYADTVLVVGAEKMTSLSTAETSRVLAKMMDPRERRYGLSMPALAALSTRTYMQATGLTREALALAPVKAHAHGQRNPYAQFQKAITVEEVLASAPVADPLRVYDCAPVSDGAAALVLTSRRGPVRVAGVGQASDTYALLDRPDPEAFLRFRNTTWAAEKAFARSGLTQAQVDVVEMHDAFSWLEFMNLEDLGFFKRGEALRALRAGETSLGGRLPVNVSGGLKARGHPVGATGAAMVAELFWQLSGRAGPRQVDGARVGLAHNIGGYGNNTVVTLLEAAA